MLGSHISLIPEKLQSRNLAYYRDNYTSNGRCAVDREFVHIERGRRRRRPGMGARWPEGGQEGACQHPGIAAGGNWREPGEAGAGAGQGPGVTLNPSALVPTSAEIT